LTYGYFLQSDIRDHLLENRCLVEIFKV